METLENEIKYTVKDISQITGRKPGSVREEHVKKGLGTIKNRKIYFSEKDREDMGFKGIKIEKTPNSDEIIVLKELTWNGSVEDSLYKYGEKYISTQKAEEISNYKKRTWDKKLLEKKTLGITVCKKNYVEEGSVKETTRLDQRLGINEIKSRYNSDEIAKIIGIKKNSVKFYHEDSNIGSLGIDGRLYFTKKEIGEMERRKKKNKKLYSRKEEKIEVTKPQEKPIKRIASSELPEKDIKERLTNVFKCEYNWFGRFIEYLKEYGIGGAKVDWENLPDVKTLRLDFLKMIKSEHDSKEEVDLLLKGGQQGQGRHEETEEEPEEEIEDLTTIYK